MKMKLSKLAYDWIKYLKKPSTKKAYNALCDNEKDGHRCCLGHLCHVAGIKKNDMKSKETLRDFIEVRKESRLRDKIGTINTRKISPNWKKELQNEFVFRNGSLSLIDINDGTNWSMQKIGRFIDENREAIFKP